MPGLSRRGRRSRLAAALLLTLTALATVTFASTDRGQAQSAALGDENSWLRIQNVGLQAAHVDVDFYNPDGARAATDRCPRTGVCDPIPSGSGRSFFQQTFGDLPLGYRGSAFVTSDQPFTALLARDILRPDGQFRIAGDSLRLGSGASEYFLPWVVNNDEYVSRIVVQNTSDSAEACVAIVYYSAGAGDDGRVDPASGDPACPNGGARVAPRGTFMRDEQSIAAPYGFDGAARVRTFATSTTAASAQHLAVMVDTRSRQGSALSTYRGIGADETSQTVLLPLVDRNATQGQSTYTTRFRILSASPAQPNEVKLLFVGQDGAGADVELETTVTVNGVLTCEQRLNACLPEGKTLPDTFLGTVRMQAVNPIAAVVQRQSSDGSLADYRGFTGAEASTQVVLPVADKNYGPFGGNSGWNSWFRVLAFDGSAANVYVVYYGRQFPAGLFPRGSLPVSGAGRTFRQWEDERLPDGWVGSAVVVSDRPIVVVANLESDVFDGDPVMLYNGIPLK